MVCFPSRPAMASLALGLALAAGSLPAAPRDQAVTDAPLAAEVEAPVDLSGQLAVLGGAADILAREREDMLLLAQNFGPDYAAQVEVRLGSLEQQLRALTGQIEQLQYQLQQQQSRLERALNDIEYRLSVLEGSDPSGLGSDGAATFVDIGEPATPLDTPVPPATATEPAATAATTDTLGVLIREQQPTAATGGTAPLSLGTDPEGHYNQAYALLQGSNFAGAESAFANFVRDYPDHILTGNAQFWLAETYFIQGRFAEAVNAFRYGYQTWPEGSKAGESLLKLGMSYGALGRGADACQTLNLLQADVPSVSSEILRRSNQERDRLQCR